MDTKLVRDIRRIIDVKPTDELLRIYRRHDGEEWSDETFEVIRQILLVRGEVIPTIHPIPSKEPEQKNLSSEDLARSSLSASSLDLLSRVHAAASDSSAVRQGKIKIELGGITVKMEYPVGLTEELCIA
jgi:hypothetical protein